MTCTRLAPIAVLLLATSCSFQPKWGKEASGQPALVLHGEPGAVSGSPDTGQPVEPGPHAPPGGDGAPPSTPGADVESLFQRAVLLREKGDLAGAAELYRQALDITESKLGPNDADVAAILNNLAGVEAAQGHYDAALPLLERTLSIRQQALGESDVQTAESMNNLALLYAAQGNAVAAEPLYEHAISILEQKGAPARAQLARVLDNYAALLEDTGRDADGHKLQTRARLIRAGAAPEQQD